MDRSRLLGGLLVLLVCLLPAPTAGATLPSGNLLQNGDAEGAACATDGSEVSIPGWATTSPFTVVCYGNSSSFPTTTVSSAIGGGNGFFAGGPSGSTASATQAVDVTSAAADIDGGAVEANLSGYLGGYFDQADNMVVTAAFYDGANNSLGSAVQIGPVTNADRNNQTTLLARSATAAVPSGTRQIRVTMTSTRTDGSYDDGYADNLQLTLTAGTPPPTPVTEPATNVGASATLNGTLAPDGHDCAEFEYYPLSIYGFADQFEGTSARPPTACQDPATDGQVSTQLGTLYCGTIYHYRIVGVDKVTGLKSYGQDAQFATSPCSSGGVQAVAINAGTTTAGVSVEGWAGDVDGATVYVQYSGPVSGLVTAHLPGGYVELQSVSAQLTGLIPGSTYTLTIWVQNSVGAGLRFTTTMQTNPSTATVVSEKAQLLSSSSAQISGKLYIPETGWPCLKGYVEYGPTSSYGTNAPSVAVGPCGFQIQPFYETLNGLSPGRTYHYRIRVGGLQSGADQTFSTPGVFLQPVVIASGSTATQTLNCLTATSCIGTITLKSTGAFAASATKKRAVVLGTGRFRIAAHKRGTARIRLTSKAIAALRHRRKLTVVELLKERVAGGHTATLVKRVALKR